MDNSKEHEIKVSLINVKSLVFKECNHGLYHLNIHNINKDAVDYSCLPNVN